MLAKRLLHWSGVAALVLVVGLTVAFFAEATAAGQTSGTGSEQAGTVTVIGRGEAVGRPDRAEIQVGVDTFADSVEAATSENQASVAAIMTALQELGIAEEDIQTTNYSLFAEQRYGENGPEGIAGYRVTNQVNVVIHDITRVGEVLQTVTEAGANNIFGVRFSVADPAALENEARSAAMADARTRAEALAQLGQVELGQMVTISEVVGQPSLLEGRGGGVVMAEEAAARPGINPGQMAFQVQVQVAFAID